MSGIYIQPSSWLSLFTHTISPTRSPFTLPVLKKERKKSWFLSLNENRTCYVSWCFQVNIYQSLKIFIHFHSIFLNWLGLDDSRTCPLHFSLEVRNWTTKTTAQLEGNIRAWLILLDKLAAKVASNRPTLHCNSRGGSSSPQKHKLDNNNPQPWHIERKK